MKASYHTLGCKLNFSETSTIEAMLRQKGISPIEEGETPDICIVNTCSVTANADKKGRQLIRSLAKKYPDAAIMVTGCYAQLKPQEVASLPNVALVVGSNEKLRMSQYIDSWMQQPVPSVITSQALKFSEFLPSCERGERTRFFLKVQDGCDYFCTYCTIPYARGRSRSGEIPQLIELARQAAEKGGKEIVITGVNIGTFGLDRISDITGQPSEDFFALIRALDRTEGIERFRISSIEPNLLTDEIIEWIASESRAFMPHFHIPLQSGSDRVLKLMNRRYDTALFAARIEKIRSLIPDAFIGVDIIAGARGETPEEWQKSYEFAKNLQVAKFHAFPYSERQGTKALLIGQTVDQAERYRRVAQLNLLSEQKNAAFISQNFGTTRKVLWEQRVGENHMQGLTDNYIRVEAPLQPELFNTISEVEIKSLKPSSNEIAIASHK